MQATNVDESIKFVPTAIIDKFPDSISDTSYEVLLDFAGPRTFGPPELGQQELKDELLKLTIGVAPYVKVEKIPDDEVERPVRKDKFEYFRVHSGMNINVPQGRLKKIRFYLSIFGDGMKTGNALAIDGFPNDRVKHVEIINGKIQLSINKLLKIIPYPIAQVVSDAISIELNPWEVDWGYDRLEVGFSEALNNDIDWYLSANNVNQSFGCYFTLRKHVGVMEVKGHALAIWEYEPQSASAAEWLLRRLHVRTAITRDKDEKVLDII